MNFLTFCDKCHKEMSPVVDKKTLVAYCTECDSELSESVLSPFMRRQMAAHGMIKKANKERLAWSVKCPTCQKEGPPELDKDGKKLVCSYCKAELSNISGPFAQTIKSNLLAKRKLDVR